MGEKEIHGWVEDNMGAFLGYDPETFILINGWFCFVFRNSKDVDRVLQKIWLVKNRSLMLSRW
jgi:hypothetical protein